MCSSDLEYDFSHIQDEMIEKHKNKLLEIVRFSNLSNEKEDNIPVNMKYLWDDILSNHPTTKNIFLKGKGFDIQHKSTYKKIIDKLKNVREDMAFSSDFIVGFPGETEEDFQDTLDVIDSVKFDESFSFIYSPRPNTTAKDLEDNVPNEEKKERLSVLQHKLENSAISISRKMVGKTSKCLVTGVSKKNPGEFQARAENNKVVIFPCSDPSIIGNIIDIEIVNAQNKSLKGIAV